MSFEEDGYLIINDQDLLKGIDVDNIRQFVTNSGSLRLQDGWMHNDNIRKVATNKYVLNLLEEIFKKKPFPFQTLNFLKSPSQPFHQDFIHFSSHPDPNYMVGVFMALEDIGPNQGPLKYAVGSHKQFYTYQDLNIPTPTGQLDWNNPQTQSSYAKYEEIMEQKAKAFEIKTLEIKKGSCLIWAAGLLHGSIEKVDPESSRHSQVSHYFFEGMDYLTAMFSDYNKKKFVWRNPHRIE